MYSLYNGAESVPHCRTPCLTGKGVPLMSSTLRMMIYPSRPCVPLGRIEGHSQDGSVCQPALHDSPRQRLLKHPGTQCTVVLYGARHWQSLRTQ